MPGDDKRDVRSPKVLNVSASGRLAVSLLAVVPAAFEMLTGRAFGWL